MAEREYMASGAVVDKLWTIIANVDDQSAYWTREQLVWLARQIEPPAHWPSNSHREEQRP